MDLPHDDTSGDIGNIDRFLERATEADAVNRLADEMSRDESRDIFDKACDISGYEIPVPGTMRYDEARQKICSLRLQELAFTLLTGDYEDGYEETIKQLIGDNLDSETEHFFDIERIASNMAVDVIQHLKDVERIAPVAEDYVELRKRELFAAIVVELNVPVDNPVIHVINVAVPGRVIDLLSPEMDLYYRAAQERMIKYAPRIERLQAVSLQSYEIARMSDEISDKDRENIITITSRFTEESLEILSDNSISLTSRRQQLEKLATGSPLGRKTVFNLIAFIRTNLGIYQLKQ